MNRIVFFIDGFNLYHALAEKPEYYKYKWIDLFKLANCFIKKTEKIVGIYYFTALATWDLKKMAKHKTLIKALELRNVNIVYGEFKRKDKFCRRCRNRYQTFEEKQTDVNIAIYLFELAIRDIYDTAIIVTGDSDLIPAIKAVRKTFPSKKIGIIIPIGRRSEDLKANTDFHIKMKEKHLRSSMFEDVIKLNDTEELKRPSTWI